MLQSHLGLWYLRLEHGASPPNKRSFVPLDVSLGHLGHLGCSGCTNVLRDVACQVWTVRSHQELRHTSVRKSARYR